MTKTWSSQNAPKKNEQNPQVTDKTTQLVESNCAPVAQASLLGHEEAIKKQPTGMNCIEAVDLSHRFAKNERVLDNINLTVQEGSIFGFLGPNGAGKTTTLRLILGLLRKQQGEIRLAGHPGRVFYSGHYGFRAGYVCAHPGAGQPGPSILGKDI